MTHHNRVTSNDARRAILVRAQLPQVSDLDTMDSLDELTLLVEGLGFNVAEKIVQKRAQVCASSYLGEGKIAEIAALTGGPGFVKRGPQDFRQPERDQDENSQLTVVVDDELTPGQLRFLTLALGVDVLDRTAVILRIFEMRAHTREAKIEVEIAKAEYELPRIRDDHSLGDREGGGGRASRGHTNVELAKQRSRDRIASLRRDLERVTGFDTRRSVAPLGVFRAALVGYTNAGKSAVMRALTGSSVLVEDKLFATLGTTTRKLEPPTNPQTLITDTVGFLNRLPHLLIASFRSTLSEAKGAGLLLHIVDVSNPQWRVQRDVTNGVLKEIGLEKTPMWLIFNKIDKLGATALEVLKREFPDAVFLCALRKSDGDFLKDQVVKFFQKSLVKVHLSFGYEKQSVLAEFRDKLTIENETYEDVVKVTVRGSPEIVQRLKTKLGS